MDKSDDQRVPGKRKRHQRTQFRTKTTGVWREAQRLEREKAADQFFKSDMVSHLKRPAPEPILVSPRRLLEEHAQRCATEPKILQGRAIVALGDEPEGE